MDDIESCIFMLKSRPLEKAYFCPISLTYVTKIVKNRLESAKKHPFRRPWVPLERLSKTSIITPDFKQLKNKKT